MFTKAALIVKLDIFTVINTKWICFGLFVIIKRKTEAQTSLKGSFLWFLFWMDDKFYFYSLP